ncbi:IS1634 family transposase [Mycoplasma sp. 4423]
MKNELKVFNVSGNKKGITYKYVGWYKGEGDRNYVRWFSLGLISELEKINKDAMNILKRRVKKFSKNDNPDLVKAALLSSLRENQIKGVHIKMGNKLIYELIDEYNIFNCMSQQEKHKKLKYVFYYLISRRITEPSSILRSFISQKEYIESQEVSKNTFYRTLDFVAENQNTLLQKLNEMVLKKTNRSESEIYFDSTTVYFETFKRKGYKKNGYSKDGKFKEDQIVIGLACDRNGIPYHIKIYRGNTADPRTFIPFILEVQKTYNVNDLTVVADRGMSTNSNIRFLEQKGFKFVISYRARKGGKKFKELLLEKSGYIQLNNDVVYKEEIAISTFHKKRPNGHLRRKIITYSIKRAKKDKADRDKMIEDFQKKLDKNGYIDPSKMISSYKCQFFRQVSNLKFELDVDKVNRHKEFDGIYVYETNLMDEKVDKIMNIYKNQWKIEENFRSLKTYLEIRPVYVWVEEHIIGHMLICFASLVILKFLVYLFKEFHMKTGISYEITEEKLINLISNVSISNKVDIYTNEVIESIRNEITGFNFEEGWTLFNDYCETVRKNY